MQATKFSNPQLRKVKDEGLYIPVAFKSVDQFTRFQEIKVYLLKLKRGQAEPNCALECNTMKVTFKGDLEETQLKIMLDSNVITPSFQSVIIKEPKRGLRYMALSGGYQRSLPCFL